MSGGKGGSTSTSVEIPEYIEEAARRNLAKAEGISQIGYVPYFGPDVAAFTPFQQAGFQQTADVASAFGLGPQMSQADVMGGMPAPTEFAGGVRGYSAAPLYQQAVDELAAQRPAQAQYIESFFIDPVTGQAGTRVQPAVDYSTMGTIADIRAADRANELAIAQAQAAAGPQSVYNFTPSTEVLVGPTTVGVGGQEVQYYNPDIDYGDAFTAESGQQVGVLDPNQAALDAMQAEAGVDPSFYTETPIYSASDFPLGSSLSGTDYTTYAPSGSDGLTAAGTPLENNVATNQFGSTVSVGYDGAADPRLAAAAGFSLAGAAQPVSSIPPADAAGPSDQYTGFIDMIDGGGPNAAGGPFEGGGLLSDIGNFVMGGGITGAAIGALEEALGIGQAAPSAPAIDPNKRTIRYTPLGDGTSSYQLFDAAGNLQQSGNQAGDISTMFGADTASKYNIVEEAPATPPSPADTGSSDVNAIMESILGPAVSVGDPMFAGGAAGFVDPDLPAPIIVPQRDDSFRNEPISFAPTTGRATTAPPSKPARRFGGGGK